MRASWIGALTLVLSGCGGGAASGLSTANTPRHEVARAPSMDPVVLADALVARFETPFCEGDTCLDPFPLGSVHGFAASVDRIALAGPGGLVSVYANGEWETHVAHDHVVIHDVAFSPDGAMLFAVGDGGRVFVVEGDTMRLFARVGDAPEARAVDGESLGRGDAGPILSGVLALSRDELYVTDVGGGLHHVRGQRVESERLFTHLDHVFLRDPSDRTAGIVVSGPFGGAFRVHDGEEWTRFRTPEQREAAGRWSGCGAAAFDPRAELEALVQEYVASGMDEREARAQAEGEVDLSAAIPAPPPGLEVPRSGWPDGRLLAALEASPRGRAVRPFLEEVPATPRLVRTRGRASAAVRVHWDEPATLLVRFASGALRRERLTLEGDPTALDVDGEHAVVVSARGSVAWIGASGPPVVHRIAALGAGAAAVRLVGPERALVATAAGTLHEIDLRSGSERANLACDAHLLAIDGEGDALLGAGRDGALARIEGARCAPIVSGVSADLTVVRALGPRRFAVGGRAGTWLRVSDDDHVERFERLTSDTIVDMVEAEGALFAETEGHAVLRAVDGTFGARGARRSRGHDGMWWRFDPHSGGAWLSRSTPLAVALDEPEAVAPFAALRTSYDPTHDPFPDANAVPVAAARVDDYEWGLFEPEEMICCDPQYEPTAGERILGIVSEGPEACAQSEQRLCAIEPFDAAVLSIATERTARVVALPGSVGSGETRCDPVRLDVASLRTGQVTSSETIGCDQGWRAHDVALVTRLAQLSLDAEWVSGVWSDVPLSLEGPRAGIGAVARGREILIVHRGNRAVRVVTRTARPFERAIALEWFVAGDVDRAFVLAVGEGAWRAAPLPAALRASSEDDERRADPEDCESLVIHDRDGETTLRAQPTSRSTALRQLPNGTEVQVRARSERWIQLEAPHVGWIFDRNARCAP